MTDYAPRVAFQIGGMQKAGTTAMARYLGLHPHLALPVNKEAHVFDAPDYQDAWTAREVDMRFAPHFAAGASAALHGDATPITVFHETFIKRVAGYNPAMRWIILLRDPVERAISHYHMERARGAEDLSLLGAIRAERRRLRGHEADFSTTSPLRVHSYAARSRYARQLDVLAGRFPREQILLLRSRDLRSDPAATVRRALEFLELPWFEHEPDFKQVFVGAYPRPPVASPGRLLLRYLLRHEIPALRSRYGVDLASRARAQFQSR